MKRYFLVFSFGTKSRGISSFMTPGNYLNIKTTHAQLCKENGDSTIIITNIIELTKEDYENWIEK